MGNESHGQANNQAEIVPEIRSDKLLGQSFSFLVVLQFHHQYTKGKCQSNGVCDDDWPYILSKAIEEPKKNTQCKKQKHTQ